MSFFCEGAGDDEFVFQIFTGISDDILEQFEEGKIIRAKKDIKVLKRVSEKEDLEDLDD